MERQCSFPQCKIQYDSAVGEITTVLLIEISGCRIVQQKVVSEVSQIANIAYIKDSTTLHWQQWKHQWH